MTPAATVTPAEVRAYARAVAGSLADLPDADRGELVEDLEQHLAEVAAETPGGLVEQLGAPEDYAAELRRSAGLPPPPATATDAPRMAERVLARVRARGAAVAALPLVAPALAFLPELRPAWWAARGWLLAIGVGVVASGQGWAANLPWPGRGVVGLLFTVVAIVVSVRVSRAGPRGRPARWLVRGANVLGAWTAFLLLVAGTSEAAMLVHPPGAEVFGAFPAEPPALRHPDSEPITNIYAYDDQGRPVDGVRLFDGGGRPIEVGEAPAMFGLETDYRRAADGTPLTNRYPLEQYELRSGEFGEPTRRLRPRPRVEGLQLPGSGTATATAPDSPPADHPSPTADMSPTDRPSPADSPSPTADMSPTDSRSPTADMSPTDRPSPAATPSPTAAGSG